MMTVDQIIDALPDGFEPDWTQDFGDEASYCMSGADDSDALSGMPDDIRQKAEAYWADVWADIRTAREYEDMCIRALRDGDYPAALEAIQLAAECENKHGDCPTYAPIVGQIMELAEWEDSKLEWEDSEREWGITDTEASYIHPLWYEGEWFVPDGAPEFILESLREKGYVGDRQGGPLSAEGNAAYNEWLDSE